MTNKSPVRLLGAAILAASLFATSACSDPASGDSGLATHLQREGGLADALSPAQQGQLTGAQSAAQIGVQQGHTGRPDPSGRRLAAPELLVGSVEQRGETVQPGLGRALHRSHCTRGDTRRPQVRPRWARDAQRYGNVCP